MSLKDFVEKVREWKQRYIPWFDIGNPQHQLGLMVAVIILAFVVQEGGLPVDLPVWQLLLVAALVWIAMGDVELPFDPPQFPEDRSREEEEPVQQGSEQGIGLPPLDEPEDGDDGVGEIQLEEQDILGDDFEE